APPALLRRVYGCRVTAIRHRADSRDMDKPFHSGPARQNCHPLGSLDMHRVKRLPSVLDVETDRIDRAISVGQSANARSLVVNIGSDRSKFRIAGTEQSTTAIRMP